MSSRAPQQNHAAAAAGVPAAGPAAAPSTPTALVTTTPPTPTTASASPAATPAAGQPADASAAAPVRNTPRTIAQLRVAVVVTSILFAVLCLVGTALPYEALANARLDIEQGQLVRNAQASLARAQALAAEAADPRVNGAPAGFREQVDGLSAALVFAAAAFPADAGGLGQVAAQVGGYRAAVELGLAQKTATDASKAQASVDAANRSSSATAGAGLESLRTNADNRLPQRFATTVAPLVVAAAAIALLTALAAATVLAMRTRRVVNLGLTASVLALLLALFLAVSASSAASGGAGVSQGSSLAGARAAVETQALIEQARVAQLAGAADGRSWAQLSAAIRERLTTVGAGDATASWTAAEAAQAKGDLPATRTAIDKTGAALAQVAQTDATAAASAVSFERVLTYGIGASALALLAAGLASWGLTTRLNEYR